MAEFGVVQPESFFQFEERGINFSGFLLGQVHKIVEQIRHTDACVMAVIRSDLLRLLLELHLMSIRSRSAAGGSPAPSPPGAMEHMDSMDPMDPVDPDVFHRVSMTFPCQDEPQRIVS